MPSFCRVAPELVTPDFEDVIYVAAGKDVKEGKAKLVWTVNQSRGNVKICIIHVLVPSKTIPMGGLGAEIPANLANEILLREHRENERINMHKILDTYLHVCTEMGVPAEKKYIESDSVQKGIVELICLHGIRKLVMGAAADGRCFKKMTEIKSRKAIFVRDKAHISCQIRFILNRHLIHTREARTAEAIGEVPTDATSPTSPALGAGKSVFLKSRSDTQRSGTAKLSNPFRDLMRRAFSVNADRHSARPIASPPPDSTPSDQSNLECMLETHDTPQELTTSLSHHLQLIPSVYHTGHSSFSNTPDLDENGMREVLEEGAMTRAEDEVGIIESRRKDPRKRLYAEKLKEEHEKVMEELRIAQAQKSQLKDQFVETDQSRKELELKIIASEEILRALVQKQELLRIELENALLKAEEESRRKGDSSGTKFFSEFSFTEIAEAAQNFDPSLKIGKGGCGTVYRGLLRLTPVAIKIMNGPSTRGSQEFQQEIDVLREVKHPNLITLIGACPQPCTLVYEYIPNGSLEHWLHDSDRAKQLPWRARICIATELCSALAFLHSWEPHSIVHGDVKPGNILLDAHFKSKLSDFGISRLLSGGERSSNNTAVLHLTNPKGTFGYVDPEFVVTHELTTRSDVYSFGIILLELLTRRPALGIANAVQEAISTGTLAAILDSSAGEWPYTLAEKLTHLALSCCEMSRRSRPDLKSEVGTVLQSIRASC
ncbi:U-box domain-containing protein 33 [Eucalyptus grandis]|uniref:U-box domain-containing protein 33 n=1 Tax=Eucalyptus grandis TaxID=71139 RepID=UPI00192EC2E2|nr:U-box domain-containing protein 33 [Eucalyptus grandis]